MLELVNTLFAYGTAATNVALLVYLGLAASGKDGFLVRRVGRYGYRIALAVAWLGVVGSLYYSEIAGWEPCSMCWWQRIALYPTAVILSIAVLRNEERRVSPYVAVLLAAGAAFSAYHLYLQFGPPALAAVQNGCVVGGGVSCSETYNVSFGYISMATSALSAFMLGLAGLHLAHRAERHESNAKAPI